LQVELGEVIATRVLHLIEGEGPSVEEVVVKIGKPVPFPDGRHYICPFQITGMGDEETRYAAGIDAVQALQLVMIPIGGYLVRLNQSCGGRLRWDGDEHGDLGFPTLE